MSEVTQKENAVHASEDKAVKFTLDIEHKDILQKGKAKDECIEYTHGKVPLEAFDAAYWTMKITSPTVGETRSIVFDFKVKDFPANIVDDYFVQFSVRSNNEEWTQASSKKPIGKDGKMHFEAVQLCKVSPDTCFTASLELVKRKPAGKNEVLKILLEQDSGKYGDQKLASKGLTAKPEQAVSDELSVDKDDGKSGGNEGSGDDGEPVIHDEHSCDKTDEKPAAGDDVNEKANGKPAADNGPAGEKAEGEPEAKKSRKSEQ